VRENKEIGQSLSLNEPYERRLYKIVQKEIAYLESLPEYSGRKQAMESAQALKRLGSALYIKKNKPTEQGYVDGDLCLNEVLSTPLETMSDMLSAQFKTWRNEYFHDGNGESGGIYFSAKFVPQLSLRQALNVSPTNFFNWSPIGHFFAPNRLSALLTDGTWGPFFSSRTDSLAYVEQEIEVVQKTNTCGQI